MSKLSNDEIYQKLMDSRTENPKRYACTTIAIHYWELKDRLVDRTKFEKGEKTSKKFRPISDEEIAEMKNRIKEVVYRMVRIYGITQKDIDEYNKYAVGKIKISIA